MRWIPVTERLPEGADAVSCEAWCKAESDTQPDGPCVMMFDADEELGLRWMSREDTGCWEPGEVTHWRPRPSGPDANPTITLPIPAPGFKWAVVIDEDAAGVASGSTVAGGTRNEGGK